MRKVFFDRENRNCRRYNQPKLGTKNVLNSKSKLSGMYRNSENKRQEGKDKTLFLFQNKNQQR